MVFEEKSNVNVILVLISLFFVFVFVFFKILSVCFCNLILIYLGIVFWYLICLVFPVLPGYVDWCLSLILKYSQSLLFQIFFSALFSFFLSAFLLHICIFSLVSQLQDFFFHFFLFSVWEVSMDMLILLMRLSGAFFISVMEFLILALPLVLGVSTSLPTLVICSCMLYIFFPVDPVACFQYSCQSC